jgi:uncharacterized protein YuzE
MTERSLQVTYRKGRAFAAYLHLSHTTGDRSARTVASADGLLIVDYNTVGQAVGIEITAPRCRHAGALEPTARRSGTGPTGPITSTDPSGPRNARLAAAHRPPHAPSMSFFT